MLQVAQVVFQGVDESVIDTGVIQIKVEIDDYLLVLFGLHDAEVSNGFVKTKNS